MNSKVMERPVTATGAKAKLKQTITPQSIVNDVERRITELEAMLDVATATGDRGHSEITLQFAGAEAMAAAQQFDERDSGLQYGYCALLNVESLAATAAALAQQEADSDENSLGRALSIKAIATASAELTTIFDANQRAIDEWMKAQPVTEVSKAQAGKTYDPVNDAYEAEGWVDIALETLQPRLDQLGSNVAYGIRSLMQMSKQAIHEYNSVISAGKLGSNRDYDTAYNNATKELGIAIDTLDYFNDDGVDDKVLYAVSLCLNKARDLLLEITVHSLSQGVAQ